MTTLKKGINGEEVKGLQNWLNWQGFTDNNQNKLKEDGYFGNLTKQAVIKFQITAGIKADGIYGPISQGAAYRYGKAHPNGNQPKPTPIITGKPELIQRLESKLGGSINSLTDFYHLIQRKGAYRHFKCLQGTLDNAVNDIISPGNNCARYSLLGKTVSDALNNMGKKYTTRYIHVDCQNSKHFPDTNAGHYFLLVKGEEFPVTTAYDLAEAASAGRGIGSTMCIYGYTPLSYDKLC